jgi:MFS family permease
MAFMNVNPTGPARVLFITPHAGHPGLESAGLWLIAIGAVIAVVGLLVGGHLAGLSGRPVGPVGRRNDRVAYAGAAAGAVLVAAGSILVAIKNVPAWWVILLTAAGAGALFWAFAAWRLRVDHQNAAAGAQESVEDTRSNPNLPTESPLVAGWNWDAERYLQQVSWRWCLAHAFASEARARVDAERELGPRP